MTIRKPESDLGRIYRRLLSRGLRLYVNDRPIRPFDPLFLDPGEGQARSRQFGNTLAYDLPWQGGATAAAYSSAKAASLHLARCLAEEGGPQGIRVNTVNPVAVIEGSGAWSSDSKSERAATFGIAEGDLQAFYRNRTRLGVDVHPEDVAAAIDFFAGPRSTKSTGNVFNVDGGVTAAYPP